MDPLAIFSGLTNAISIYKTAIDVRDETKITTATNDIQIALAKAGAHIIAMQNQETLTTEQIRTLKDQIHKLEKEITNLKEKISDKARYELQEPYPGTIVYALKELANSTEPKHYLCQSCMDNGSVKSILQANPEDYTTKICPSCKHTYLFDEWMPIA